MVQRLPEADAYRFDPAHPRAPSVAQWERMSTDERARVVAMLPSEYPSELQQRVTAEAERADAEAEHAARLQQENAGLLRRLAEMSAELERLKKPS